MKLLVVTLVGVAGGVDSRIGVLGAVRSMSQLRLAGDGSTLPDESIARTSKVWEPAARPLRVRGLVHAANCRGIQPALERAPGFV